MPEIAINLIKGDATDDKTDYRDALPVNFTGVSRAILGAQGYMLSHSGLTQHATGVGIDRGATWNSDQREHFRVSGTELITVSAAGAVSSKGTISGTEQASLAHSVNTQAIVADLKMWLYDGTVLTEITDSDLGEPIDICWIDGYYFLTDGKFLFHTLITDEYQIDPLQFAASDFSPDPVLAVAKTVDNQVIVLNRFSTEWFINRATDNFAFQRIAGKSVKSGIIGTHCKTELDSKFYVIGGAKDEATSIHIVAPGSYQSIASREVDKVLAAYTEDQLSTAVLETRVEDRDKFIVVRLPNETLLYNVTLSSIVGNDSSWTIVKSDVSGDTKWRGANGVSDPRIPSWVYGDNQDSRIGLLDGSVSTQYGEQIEQILYTPLIDIETGSINNFEIDSIPGHQVNTDDVTVAFSLTFDGLTYGQEYWMRYGEKNKYGQRFIANRLGYVGDNVGFKLRCASPERLAFSLMKLDVS